MTGPTASGKTAVAVRCARALGAHIVGADSRQIYARLRIGTARPTEHEMDGVVHHLVGTLDPSVRYSAGAYIRDALAIISELHARGIPIVVAGGAGMYLGALIDGFADTPEIPADIHRTLLEELDRCGLAALVSELADVDPATHARIDRANPRRVLRALELFRTTGRPVDEVLRTCHQPSPLAAEVFVLDWPRDTLYARIDARVNAMLDAGLVEETRSLLDDGVDAACPAFDSVGYTEVLAHFAGELTREQMRLLIAQRTRNYAKRQLTWFRHRLVAERCSVRSEEELDHVHERIVSAYLQCREQEASALGHP